MTDMEVDGAGAESLPDRCAAAAARVTAQASLVRQLKKDAAAADAVAEAVAQLQSLKLAAADLQRQASQAESAQTGASGASSAGAGAFPRRSFDDLMIRKMFIVPAFEIHGGVKGLYDLGPPACALKAAMIELWRKHFVLTERMLEMECTALTPHAVLKASGHVDRFTDLMVRDPQTGDCFRADKLLEDAIDALLAASPDMPPTEREEHLRVQRQADAWAPSELDALLVKYGAVGPSGQPYAPCFPFNLMFKTSIGPEGTAVGYLRPETAQGLFVNFRRLLEQNAGRTPFAAAQVGLGFRNEIAPRSGLLRVREFCMAEIEHFVHPQQKAHAGFGSVRDTPLVLFGREDQLGSGKTRTLPVGEAVASGLIDNETLGYFMARTQLYMERIGMDPRRLRFRQHLHTEMAHYATDCWDLEIQSSYGWVECVGHADRACYDLQVHSQATKTPMVATMKVDPPQRIEIAKIKLDRKSLGQAFKQDQRVVANALETLAESWADFEPVATALETEGKATVEGFEITKAMVSWEKTSKMVHEIKFTPSVIEPSFGMGRILYSLLEHSFYQREHDEQRCVMRFNPQIAPEKCAVLPISANPECNDIVDDIARDLMDSDLATRVDKSSATLGRRYARCDELGVPFAVTVDFQTVKDGSVTLRERDSCKQVRLHKNEITPLIFQIVHNKISWDNILSKYPNVQVDDGEGGTGADSGDSMNAASESTVIDGKFRRPKIPILQS